MPENKGVVAVLIKGELTYLEPLTANEAEAVSGWSNEPELRRLAWVRSALPQTIEEAGLFLAAVNGSPRSRFFGIRRLEDGELIGMLGMANLSWISLSARFASLIWPRTLWSRGYGTDARRAFLDYAFNQLGLFRVYGHFAVFNEASRRSHEKLGAVIGPVARQATFVDGLFHDHCYYAYCREHYSAATVSARELAPLAGPVAAADGSLTSTSDRIYQDFYDYPADALQAGSWRARYHRLLKREGEAVLFCEDPITRCADLLLWPRHPETIEPGLIREALARGFGDQNLHRVQAWVPAQAAVWGQALRTGGFSEEGILPGLIYARGAYHDVKLFGMLRMECR